MAKDKIRVSKPPEERRQEIMDTAMRVFAEKGYEQTTMRISHQRWVLFPVSATAILNPNRYYLNRQSDSTSLITALPLYVP